MEEFKDRLARLMREAKGGAGVSTQELVDASGVGKTTLWKLLKGKTKPGATTQQKLADALNVPVSALIDGEYYLPEYTLADCPVCESAYQLNLKSDLMPGMFEQSIDCAVQVVPWDKESAAHALWAVFRREGESRAIVARIYEDGDQLALFSAALPIGSIQSPKAQLIDGQNGQILGAIYDLLDSTELFQR